ncbi:hypothetical protein D3C77_202290 [compost metagenome]
MGQACQQFLAQCTFVQQGADQPQAPAILHRPIETFEGFFRATQILQSIGRQQVDKHSKAGAIEALGIVLHLVQRAQGRLGILAAQYPRPRQRGNGGQLCTAALFATVVADKVVERLQQFHRLIALALDQAHADLFAEQLGHRADLPQAAQVGNLLAQKRQGGIRAFLQQVQAAAADVGAHDDIGHRGVQQAQAVGDQFAGVVDAVELVECIGQQAGTEVGADRTVSAFAGGALQQFADQRFGFADLAGDDVGGQARRFGHQGHVVAAILRGDRVNVEQAPGIGIASGGVVGHGQRGQQHIAQERVFHRRVEHRLKQVDGPLDVVFLDGDGRLDQRQAAGQLRVFAQIAGL